MLACRCCDEYFDFTACVMLEAVKKDPQAETLFTSDQSHKPQQGYTELIASPSKVPCKPFFLFLSLLSFSLSFVYYSYSPSTHPRPWKR